MKLSALLLAGLPGLLMAATGDLPVETLEVEDRPGISLPEGPTSRHLELTAREALQQWLAARGIRAMVEPEALNEELRLPRGRTELRPRVPEAMAQRLPRMLVWVDAWVEGAYVRSLPVSFLVETYSQSDATAAAVAPRALKPGRTGHKSRPASSPVMSPPAPIVVARGEWVDLRYAAGGLQLSGRAEALGQARAGELVQVRLAGATQPVAARVLSSGQVEALP